MSDQSNNDLLKPAYWVGHCIVILATIIGVYLAASVGFKKAVDLEVLRADRGTYYVANSLLTEVEANLSNYEKYIEHVNTKPMVFHEHIQGIKLNDFAFEAAKFSDSTFELDPEVLDQISEFYITVGNALENYHSEQIGPSGLMKVVKRETKEMRNGSLDVLRDHVETMRKDLNKRGLNL